MDSESRPFFLLVSNNRKESVLSRVVIARIHKQTLTGQTQSGTMLNYFHSKLFIIPNKRKVTCVVAFFTESPKHCSTDK